MEAKDGQRFFVLLYILGVIAALGAVSSSFEVGFKNGMYSANEKAVKARVARWIDEEKTGVEYGVPSITASRRPLGH